MNTICRPPRVARTPSPKIPLRRRRRLHHLGRDLPSLCASHICCLWCLYLRRARICPVFPDPPPRRNVYLPLAPLRRRGISDIYLLLFLTVSDHPSLFALGRLIPKTRVLSLLRLLRRGLLSNKFFFLRSCGHTNVDSS